jgi:hypothetical protein
MDAISGKTSAEENALLFRTARVLMLLAPGVVDVGSLFVNDSLISAMYPTLLGRVGFLFAPHLIGASVGAAAASLIVQRAVNESRTAQTIGQLIPPEIATSISSRIDSCWKRYNDLLKGDHLPGDVDLGTEQLKKCVCAEVLRILALNGGSLPESHSILGDYLRAYHCEKLLDRTRNDP